MKKLLCLILALAMVLGTMGTVVFAAEGAILEVGADKEYKTINEAYDKANEGDVILVSSGEYTNMGNIPVNKAVSIIGDEADKPVVDGRFYVEIASGTFSVENLAFTTTDDAVQIRKCTDATVSVKNCDFSGISKNLAAINVTNEVANVTVEGCVFNKGNGGNYVAFNAEGGTITGTFTMKDCDANKAGRTAYLGKVENAYFENNVQGSATKVKINGDVNTLTFAGSGAGVGAWTGSISKLALKDGATLTVPTSVGFTTTLVNGDNTTYFKNLQDAIDEVEAGDNTITLLADTNENVIVKQSEGINITLDGNDNDFDGIIEIYGGARYNGAETLTIQNVNFVTDTKKDFITCNTTDSEKRYAHNVTVKDCTFTANNTDYNVVAMRFRQCYNITVEDCEFAGLHSVMQATGGGGDDGFTFDNITTENCKSGISTGTTAKVAVENSTINTVGADGYGVRTNGSDEYSLAVDNCTIKAFAPVLVREVAPIYENGVQTNNPAGYSLTVTGSTLTPTNPYGYGITVTSEDYDDSTVEIAAPEANINITLEGEHKVSSGTWDGVSVDTSWYNTTDTEFTLTSAAAFAGFAAITNGTADEIAADTFKNKTIKLGVDIDLGNYEWTPIGRSGARFTGIFDGENHTVSNLTINDESGNPDSVYLGLFGDVRSAKISNVNIENVSISTSGTRVGALAGRTYTSTVANISVTGDINISGNNYIAGVVGDISYTNVTNLDIEDTTADGGVVTGTGGLIGGIYGHCGEGGNNWFVYQDCDVSNLTISGNRMVGSIGGSIHYKNEIRNCTVNNVTIELLGGESANTMSGYGVIVGCLVNNKNGSKVTSTTANNVTIIDYDGTEIVDAPFVGAIYGKNGAPVQAKVGDTYYAMLQDAINAAQTGDTITLLADIDYAMDASTFTAKHGDDDAALFVAADDEITLDLNGKTIKVTATLPDGAKTANSGALINFGDLTIDDTSAEADGKLVFEYVGVYDGGNKRHGAVMNFGTLTVNGGIIENVTAMENQPAIDTTNYSGTDATVTINGGTVKAAGYYAIDQIGYYDFAPARVNDVVINGGVIDGGIYARVQGNTDLSLEVNDGTIKSDFAEAVRYRVYYAGNTHEINITGGTFSAADGAQDVRYQALAGETAPGFISGGSYSTNVSEYMAEGFDLYRTANGYVAIDENSEEGKATASSISVVYRDITEDDVEGEKTYAIIVKANDDDVINELASVDLTFAYTTEAVKGGAIDFTVAPAADFSITRYGTSDRYMFNYSGVNAWEGTGNEITVGTITVTGYGTYTIATADADTNVVNATTLDDNLVESYTVDGANDKDLTTGALITDATISGNVVVPTRELTINIDFPNAVVDNAAAYQAMKVEITGTIDGVNQTVAYDLGKDGEYAMANGDYVVTEDRLVLNNAYTVTVSGAGYRTARYTVTMTDDKELTFWNNVMDEDRAVEEDVFATTKTFLAGDIVKDSNINIYDLSAVVSYFAKENNTEEYSDYAKYDLDRNGVIDSRDVAYVLVSWGE